MVTDITTMLPSQTQVKDTAPVTNPGRIVSKTITAARPSKWTAMIMAVANRDMTLALSGDGD